MRKVADAGAGSLKWTQPSTWKRSYLLGSGAEQVGRLEFTGMFGTLAKAETGDGCWTFKRVGFWQQRASIRACESDQELAAFRNNTWKDGGTLEFAGGRSFRATTNFWNTKFQFENADGAMLVHFDYGGMFHLSADVVVAPAAATLPELPVLICLGWYLAVMLQGDSAAATAAASG
jgi:hypothetical protein